MWMKSVFNIFHDGGPYYAETIPLICRINEWTGFFMTRTFVMKELMLCYLHVFIEIFLEYDKIIHFYASKYETRMLFINPLIQN